jgi:flagellar motor switch/type III secretory pathway protein FliN
VIADLAFLEPRLGRHGRALREIGFARRSGLPLSAACLVANGVREHFGRLLGRALETEVIAPVVPAAHLFRVLFQEAIIRRVRGRLCEAFIAVRPDDARRFIAVAFVEPERGPTALSQVERLTLDRLFAVLPPLCVPLCGDVRGVSAEIPERAAAEARTYFEVRIASGVDAALGFALTVDPLQESVPALALEDLQDLELECAVECARGTLGVDAAARLHEGMTLPFETLLEDAGTLRVGEALIARGTCGTRGGRAAFVVR